jgi:GNAT superfamily N-acetyltransferase
MIIEQAQDADLDAIIALRKYAELWLHEAGVEQWTDTAWGIRTIRQGVADGATYIARDQGGIIASFTLNGPDPDFWGDADDPDDALYLYKFMIGPGWRGTGLGDDLLDWCCAHAASEGKRWLRLDCWRDNTGLHRYYLNRGFEHVRTMTVQGRYSGALFQRPAQVELIGADCAQ